MKFVKAILSIALLIIAVLLLIGVFVPEVDDHFEVRIDRPLVGVYASMLNTQHLEEWVTWVDSVERTGGILAMPGSTFNLHYRADETPSVYELRIIEMVPLQSVKFSLEDDGLEIKTSVRFSADGLSTGLDVFIQAKGRGIVARSFLPLMKSVLMEEVRSDFENFKRLQEQSD